MKKTTPKKEITEAELVQALRGALSFRIFEAYLNEKIPAGAPGTTTFASAWNWVNDIHPVNNASIWAWKHYYPEGDPRHQLALDLLELRHKNEPEYSAVEKKRIFQAVISHTKAGKTKEKITA